MRIEIPPFEKRSVKGSGIRFSGTTRRPVHAFEQAEKVILMVEAEVTGVNHADRAKVGLVREHAFKVLDVQVPDQDKAKVMLAELQDEFEEKHMATRKLPLSSGKADDDG